jgi:hypothetical protein
MDTTSQAGTLLPRFSEENSSCTSSCNETGKSDFRRLLSDRLASGLQGSRER